MAMRINVFYSNLIAVFFSFVCNVASAQDAANHIDAIVTISQVEGWYTVDSEEQKKRFAQEQQLHQEPTYGGAGYYVNVSFANAKNIKYPLEVRMSLLIEEDVEHPVMAPETRGDGTIKWIQYDESTHRVKAEFKKEKVAQLPLTFVPLSFWVEKNNGRIFGGYSEDMSPYEQVEALVRTCKSPTPMEVFIPWEVTHLYNVRPDIEGPFKIVIYVKVDIYDNSGALVGGGSNVPEIIYERTPKQERHIEESDWKDLTELLEIDEAPEPNENESDNDVRGTVGKIQREESDVTDDPTPVPVEEPEQKQHKHQWDRFTFYGEEYPVYTIVPGTVFPDEQKVVWNGETLVFKKIKIDGLDNIYASKKIESDTIITVNSAEKYVSRLQSYCDSQKKKLEFYLPTEKDFCAIVKQASPKDEVAANEEHYTTDSILVKDGLYIIMSDERERKESREKVIYWRLPMERFVKCSICGKEAYRYKSRLIFVNEAYLEKYKRKFPAGVVHNYKL